MTAYRITNPKSGTDLGPYEGDNAAQALDAMARDAGYADYAAACEVAPFYGRLLVEVVDAPAAVIAHTDREGGRYIGGPLPLAHCKSLDAAVSWCELHPATIRRRRAVIICEGRRYLPTMHGDCADDGEATAQEIEAAELAGDES